MIRQLGIPTFFMSFSAADRRWIEITNGILISQGKPPMTEEQHKNMTWEDHCTIIMSNPAAAARMFERRVHTLIKDVMCSSANPIGKVEDYYYRTEFQQRGWPHIHMMVWVKDAPKFDEDSDEDITEFVDKTFISRPVEGIEGNEEDLEYQEALEHRKEDETKAKETLKKIWELVEGNTDADFEQILHTAQVTQSEFEEYLALVTRKNTINLKRRIQDQWINNYNPHLIRCWNGNMDIQFVLDPFGAAMYMLSYITKSEREMGDLLRNAQREARELGNDDAVSQLRKLGSVYLQHREISVMGAIYLICSMPLRNSTRKVIFVQTDLDGHKISLPLKEVQANAGKSEQVWKTSQIEKYIGRPKTSKYNNMCMAKFFSSHYQVSGKSDNINASPDELIDDETDNEEDNETDVGDIEQTEPENEQDVRDDETNNEADNETDVEQTESENEQDVGDEASNEKQAKSCQRNKPIELQNCSIKMKERTRGKPAVIRYPRVSVKKDSERYHMNMLRLYLPHRNEQIKPNAFTKYEDYHMKGNVNINGERARVKDIVKENMKEFEPATDQLDEAWDAIQHVADLQDAWAAINPQGEQQRLDDKLDRNLVQDSDDEFAEIEIPELQSRQNIHQGDQPRCAIETCDPEITEEQAQRMMRQLNEKQRQVFNHVTKWCDDKARDQNVDPFQMFVTGGAGTGKSHVIKCIQYYAKKVFAGMTESAEDMTVLSLAHLGTAAFNICGQTICSGLKINPKSQKDYKPLGEESLNTLRVKYRHLQLVIIDEISMVSTTQLTYIFGRLQQIKGTYTDFGNVSILAVGDFYQLPPISPPTPLCFPHDEILKDIWNPLFQIVELKEIMRQKDDAIFAQMLNRLRERKKKQPLQKTDKELLESRRVEENNLTAPPDALHLFYLNKDVDSHNERKLASLNTEMFTIKANDVDQRGGRIIQVHETPHRTTRADDTSLASYLNLAVDARVMLIANVDVSDGLCNGVPGIVKGIEFCNSQNMPIVVYVKFDSDRVGAKTRTTQFIPPHYAGCVPIKPRKESFQVRGRTFTTTREQIPLKLAWAVTVHKVQGQTTDQAVISMKGLRKSMAYVALSRVTHLEGMYLMDYDESRIFCNEDIEANVAKMPTCDLSKANPLTEIDHNTNFVIIHHNIQSLHRHIDDLKKNPEIRKAHVICLSETWLTDDSNLDSVSIEGYTLEVVNSGNGRGVAMYIQNGIRYTVVPLFSNECDILAIRTSGKTNLLVATIYKPMATSTSTFSTEMNNITAQMEVLDTDYKVLVGDFNRNLFKETILPAFRQYHQVISNSTTAKGTLLDHIYVKPKPKQYQASVMTTYYSYHQPTFIAITY
ncbi:uncharacterized protein [Amphiura filiformis]|uniref:uncharacterized protein n=1 Tax=Amphiura filiformis TaxID=82378 RepID=UPI003B20B818